MSGVTSLLQCNKLIEIDENGQIEQPVLVLSSRGGDKIGVIQNVSNINVTHPLADVAELSFDVTKEIDGKTYADWDKIKDFKFIQMPYDNTWFEATVSIDEENEIVKHVTCAHANEAELGQLNLYDTEINTESDIERDDYEETYFYNEENPKASLLNRILKDKAPHYQIYHVDDSLKGLFRVFSFNGDSIQDALNKIAEEVNCLFIYGEWDENDGKYHRTISAYDLEDYCQDCHTRGEYTNHICTNCGSSNIVDGYGEDTEIFISKENLAKSINYSSNTDNVKNCFRLVAGDDTMTSAIKSCNPSMSQYIWHFSDDMLEDMGEELATKITEYEALVEEYKNRKQIRISNEFVNFYYNSLVDKYGSINKDLVKIDVPIIGTEKLTEAYYNALNMYGFLKIEMMPLSDKVDDTSATQQLALLHSGDFTEVGIASVSGTIPYTTANSAIQSYAKVFIDTARYKVGVFTNSINGTLWNGEVTITSYSNDEDTATGTFTITLFDNTDNEKYADWLEQSVQKTMASREATDISVVNLFKRNESILSFKERLQWYSLDYLNIMSSMVTSAITVMSEQGVANQNSLDTDVYSELYLPYLEKSRAIQDEIKTKEDELSGLLQPLDENGVQNPEYQSVGFIDIIVDRQNVIRDTLDLHNYLGDELWERLSYYRRESEYSNQNYVSDGLTDSDVIKQAKDFVNVATKEIIKAATLQHTISAPLANFLLMDEFSNLQEKFKVGNWIWLQVDGKVYKLRLANWEIDYDNIDDLDIEFTDVVRVGDIISDVESILSKSKSMSTTYDYTARQAEKGSDAATTVKFFKDTGINFTQVKAITSKGNTNIVYDDDGILLKRVDVFDESPEQARIYNNGIYITRDAWETVSTGLGHFSYVDPETGENVETYGIIADTVIGKLILGENLKIYSESGKFEMGDDGLKVTAIDGEDNSDLFVVQKQKTDDQGRPYVEKYIYVDSNGDVKISGNSITIGTKPLTEYIEDAKKVATNYLSADSTGIMVADMQDGEQTPSAATGRNVFIDSDSVDVRDGQNILASFTGDETKFYDSTLEAEIASFGISGARIGNKDGQHFMVDSESINAINEDGSTIFSVSSTNATAPAIVTVIDEVRSRRSSGIIYTLPDLNYNTSNTFYIKKVRIDFCIPLVNDDDLRRIPELSTPAPVNVVAVTHDKDYTYNKVVVFFPEVSFKYGTATTLEYKIRAYSQFKKGSQDIVRYDGLLTIDYDGNLELHFSKYQGSWSIWINDGFNRTISSTYDDTYRVYNIMSDAGTMKAPSMTFGTRATDGTIAAFSTAIGEGLYANAPNQLTIGKYNLNNDEFNPLAFAIGNGTDNVDRSNAFTVDWDGDTELSGNLTVAENINVTGRLTSDGNSGLFTLDTASIVISSIGTNASCRGNINITKSGYTPIAIAGFGITGDNGWCVFPRCYITKDESDSTIDYLNFYIWNQNTKASYTNVTIEVKILYIASSAF